MPGPEEQSAEQTIEEIELAEEQEFSDAFAEATSDDSDNDLDELGDVEDVIPDDEPAQEIDELARITKENADLKHRLDSDAGRVAAFQRQANTLQAQLSEAMAKGSTQAEAKEEVKDELAKKVNGSSWEDLQEDFPEIAEALEHKLGSIDEKVEQMVGQRLGNIEQQIQPLTQRASNEALQSEYAALQAAHPDYETIAVSPDFNQWLNTKPVPVRQMIESNSAADAAYLLDTFKAESGANSEQKRSQNKQQNRERLQANVSVPSSRNVRREISDDDFSSAFDAAVATQNRSRR